MMGGLRLSLSMSRQTEGDGGPAWGDLREEGAGGEVVVVGGEGGRGAPTTSLLDEDTPCGVDVVEVYNSKTAKRKNKIRIFTAKTRTTRKGNSRSMSIS